MTELKEGGVLLWGAASEGSEAPTVRELRGSVTPARGQTGILLFTTLNICHMCLSKIQVLGLRLFKGIYCHS